MVSQGFTCQNEGCSHNIHQGCMAEYSRSCRGAKDGRTATIRVGRSSQPTRGAAAADAPDTGGGSGGGSSGGGRRGGAGPEQYEQTVLQYEPSGGISAPWKAGQQVVAGEENYRKLIDFP
jgi:hypothetical protein